MEGGEGRRREGREEKDAAGERAGSGREGGGGGGWTEEKLVRRLRRNKDEKGIREKLEACVSLKIKRGGDGDDGCYLLTKIKMSDRL